MFRRGCYLATQAAFEPTFLPLGDFVLLNGDIRLFLQKVHNGTHRSCMLGRSLSGHERKKDDLPPIVVIKCTAQRSIRGWLNIGGDIRIAGVRVGHNDFFQSRGG
jgi:hypothetical protein